MRFKTAGQYVPYVLKTFFASLPLAIFRRDPEWKWLIADLSRVAFQYSSMLRIPIVGLSDLYPDIDKHPVLIPSPRPALKHTEIIALASLVKHLKPKTIFEFGTFTGGGTLLLAENAKDATVYTLDLPADDHRVPPSLRDKVGIAFKGADCEKRIHQLWGDSTKFDYSPFVGQIDFIFIDAAHDYASVKSDTENALRMLSPQGVIVWHDFPSALGVRRYLLQFAKKHPVFLLRDTRIALFDPRLKEVRVSQYWGWE